MNGVPSALAALSLAGAALVMVPSTAQAEQEDAARYEVRLDNDLGRVSTPFSAAHHPRASGLLLSQTLRVRLPTFAGVSLSATLPWVLGGVDLPAGSAAVESLVGNPQIEATWVKALGALLGRGGVGIGAPTPGSSVEPGGALLANKALAGASALGGWRAPELHAPGRATLTPFAGLHYLRGLLRAEAALRVPLLWKISAAGRSEDTTVHGLGLGVVLSAGVRYDPWRWLQLGARAWLSLTPLPAAERVDQATALSQAIFEPEVAVRLSRRARLALHYLLPLGGALGGKMLAGGLRCRLLF